MDKYLLSLLPLYICFIVYLGVLMFKKRVLAIKNGDLNMNYFKSLQGEAPHNLKIIQNNFENQFQVPVLFFATCIAAVVLKSVTIFTLTLGCLFFISRLIHSYIHLGSNNLRKRGLAYFTGIILILVMWVQILLF